MSQLREIQEIKMLRDIDDLTGLLEISVFLYKFERANISNFIKDLRLNQQPVYRTLKKMTELGLLEMKTESTPKRGNFQSKFYTLTENGRKLAKHFMNMFEAYKKF